jgi:hypothetical protein
MRTGRRVLQRLGHGAQIPHAVIDNRDFHLEGVFAQSDTTQQRCLHRATGPRALPL